MAILDFILTGLHCPDIGHTPGSDYLDIRSEGLNAELKTDLVVAFAGSAVADRGSAFLAGNLNKSLGDAGTSHVVLEKGNGVYLYDVDGKKYLDFAAGIAVAGLGYNHPVLTEALKKQVEDLLHTSNLYYSPSTADAAKALAKAARMSDIANEIDRENRIINDLLALVRLDKKAAMNIQNVNINDLLERIMKRLRPIAETRNIELVLESFRPVNAEVDEMKLSLALSNLMENAIKYNKDGGWVHGLDGWAKACDSDVPEGAAVTVWKRSDNEEDRQGYQ